jgi:hypothetical protein
MCAHYGLGVRDDPETFAAGMPNFMKTKKASTNSACYTMDQAYAVI